MGVAERRERERTELREKIMVAARRLFIEHGYEAVSMRMIAREIEYSPTAIYFHFKDKAALFRELCATDFVALAGVFRQIAQVEDPVQRLRALGQAYARFAMEYPNHYRLMFMTPTPPDAEPDLARKGNPDEDAYGFLRATVADGIRRGCYRPEFSDVDGLAQLVWSAVHGAVSLHIVKECDTWVEWRPALETANALVEVMVRGLVREPEKYAP